jgi:hypothetical protein
MSSKRIGERVLCLAGGRTVDASWLKHRRKSTKQQHPHTGTYNLHDSIAIAWDAFDTAHPHLLVRLRHPPAPRHRSTL